MTKPNQFIINTDYLSIAQTGSSNHSVTLSAGTISPGSFIERFFDFSIQAQTGAIDRVLISKDGGRYYIGMYRSINPSADVYGFISVYRNSSTNIRVQIVLENYSTSTATYPSMTFDIKITSFAPPNVF